VKFFISNLVLQQNKQRKSCYYSSRTNLQPQPNIDYWKLEDILYCNPKDQQTVDCKLWELLVW